MSKPLIKRIAIIGVFVGATALTISGNAFAHVVVKPAEVVTAGFQTFTIGVPNEKNISTTTIKLIIPNGLQYVQPTQKDGWQIAVEKSGSGEDATVTSITWSGGEVMAGFRDDFTFSGKVPDQTTELQWRAYQTYTDGTVVSWDKSSSSDSHDTQDPNSGPFSVTKVVTNNTVDESIEAANRAAVVAQQTATFALYAGFAGIGVGLIGIYFGTRKKS